MIRVGNVEDVGRCVELLERAHDTSIYSASGHVDRLRARDLLFSIAMRIVAKNLDQSFFNVAVKSGVVEGFLAGIIQPVYLIGDKNETTDLFTLLSKRADPADFFKLITTFKQWTVKASALEARCAVTDIMGPRWRELLPMYERLGFEPCGAIMRWRPDQ